jgi:IS5 family transposase
MSADGLSGAEKGTFHLRRRDRGGQKAELRESGDAANVVLSAVGHNFRRILAWLRDFWRLVLTALIAAISVQSGRRSAS